VTTYQEGLWSMEFIHSSKNAFVSQGKESMFLLYSK